jgi:hypothetical protein
MRPPLCLARSTLGRVEIDHVLLATRDLAEGARELERRQGLSSVEGGRHPGWGTANRIVPLGRAYLELVAVVDPAEAQESAFGRWVADSASGPLEPFGWAVRVSDLDEVAVRHGLEIADGSRVTPTGETLRWRTAGLERAIAEPLFPFFIEWARGSTLPGSTRRGDQGAQGLARLVLSGEADPLTAWLGDHALPLELRPGPSAVMGVVVRTHSGGVVLGQG